MFAFRFRLLGVLGGVGALAVTLLLVGWTSGNDAQAQRPNRNATLVVGFPAEPAVRDPALAAVIVLRRPMIEIYEGLVTKNWYAGPDRLSIVPQLATGWKVSRDGRTYTFRLRRGVKFHDGTRFDANAVLFNFKRWLDPSFEFYYPPAAAQGRRDLEAVQRVRVPGRYAFQIILKRRFAPFLDVLSTRTNLFFVSPTAIRRFGNASIGDNPVGTGPFKFVAYVRGEQLALERNEAYWRGPAAVKRLIFKPILDPTARAAALEAGEVQVAEEVSVRNEDRWRGRRDVRVLIRQQAKAFGCWLNFREGPTARKAFREALSLATNRKTMNTIIYRGKSAPANGYYAPGQIAHEPKLPPFEFNLRKARQKLAQAGFAQGTTIVLEAIGTGVPFQPDILAIEKENLRAIGVNVDLRFFDLGTFFTKLVRGIQPGSGVNGLCFNPGTDDAFGLAVVASRLGFPDQSGFNAGYATSRAMEAAIAQAIRARSQEGYLKAMQLANRALIRDHLMLMQVAEPKVFGISSKVRWRPAQGNLHSYYRAQVFR